MRSTIPNCTHARSPSYHWVRAMFHSILPMLWLSQVQSIFLRPLTAPLDEFAQISDRQQNWEVHSRQHLHEEEVPTQQTCYESRRAAGLLQPESQDRVSVCGLPEGTGKGGETQDEEEEDADKDHVGAEGTDEVDQAQETHVQQEVGVGCLEGGICGGGCGGGRDGHVGARGIEVRGDRCAVAEPEGAEGGENDEGEGVSEDEF